MRESEVIAEPTDAAEPIDLEQALDELFAVPPEEFVATRNALAKALRGEKRRVEAGAVAAYRRPGRTAGALNRLVLSGDPAFEALLDAVDTVRSADADTYRDAVAALRQATTAAVDAVLAASTDERSEDRGDLTMALQAIVGDDDALAVLARGRLEDVPAAGLGGFGGFGGLASGGAAPAAARGPVVRRKPRLPGARGVAAAPAVPADGEDGGEPDAEVDDTLARRRAEKALRAATDAAQKAERVRAAAEAEAEAAGETLVAAEEQVAEAEAALAQAQADQQAAADAAAAAQERLDAAQETAAEAADAREAAQSDLDALA